MHNIKITFSDGKYIVLKHGDTITPFGTTQATTKPAMQAPVVLNQSTSEELITAILEILCQFDYFFVNEDQKAYSTAYVIKVKTF